MRQIRHPKIAATRGRRLLLAIGLVATVGAWTASSPPAQAESTALPSGPFDYDDLSSQQVVELNTRADQINTAAEWVASSLATDSAYGGLYVDTTRPDQLVVVVTDDEFRNEFLQQVPEDLRDSVEVAVQEFSEAELLEQARTMMTEWRAITGSPDQPHATDTHVDTGRLELFFSPDAKVTSAMVDAAEARASIPIDVRLTKPEVDSACSSRANCSSPMRAGIQIRKGSSSGAQCTMGFHIQVGSDEQFLTNGHCGYTGSNNWYHAGFGLIGSETSGNYQYLGVDAMSVQISDSQDSNLVYGTTSATSARDPIKNETICKSLGYSTPSIRCGQVTSSAAVYTSSTCNCQVIGNSTNVTQSGGDSGSPVKSGTSTAVGLGTTASGRIAPMQLILNTLGVSLRT